MKRVIKFRYWDKRDGWCGAFSVHQTGLVRFGDTPPIWQTPEEAGGVLMQSTGLTDKNGREIYEGDVLRREIGDTVHRAAVTFEEGRFVTTHPGGGIGWTVNTATSEVIGNIYENPELISAPERA